MNRGYKLITDGTDNHIVLMSCIDRGLTGSKMETALDTIRDVDISSSKETLVDHLTELKDKVIEAVPFASKNDFSKLEKKMTGLSRKMTQLKKQLKELEV